MSNPVNHLFAGDKYPTLVAMGGMEKES